MGRGGLTMASAVLRVNHNKTPRNALLVFSGMNDGLLRGLLDVEFT